jgi:hypothetical protein
MGQSLSHLLIHSVFSTKDHVHILSCLSKNIAFSELIALRSMNNTFGIEITYFGRPFRAGLGGWPHPGLKPWAVLCSPSGGKPTARSVNAHG